MSGEWHNGLQEKAYVADHAVVSRDQYAGREFIEMGPYHEDPTTILKYEYPDMSAERCEDGRMRAIHVEERGDWTYMRFCSSAGRKTFTAVDIEYLLAQLYTLYLDVGMMSSSRTHLFNELASAQKTIDGMKKTIAHLRSHIARQAEETQQLE
jgi:hypothetical protein